MLSQKKCIAVPAGTPAMVLPQARELLKQIPDWELALDNRAIKRRFVFKDFTTALAFINKISEVLETEQHHADLMLGWGYVECIFWTHTVSGLHENDFIMAAKVNALL